MPLKKFVGGFPCHARNLGPASTFLSSIDNIRTDASTSRWGTLCVNDNSFAQGVWSREEANLHINALELLAIHRGLASLCDTSHKQHIHIKSDNSAAVSYVRKMSGSIPLLNKLSYDIWAWSLGRYS